MNAVLAVDPGRDKCGLAVATPEAILFRAIVPTAEIGLTCHYLLARHPAALVLVGDATGSAPVAQAIRAANPQATLQLVPEAHTSLQARRRYFRDNPADWWQKLIPAGMRLPPRPVDDYAAVLLAERFFSAQPSI
jgi:hypothetical protein